MCKFKTKPIQRHSLEQPKTQKAKISLDFILKIKSQKLFVFTKSLDTQQKLKTN